MTIVESRPVARSAGDPQLLFREARQRRRRRWLTSAIVSVVLTAGIAVIVLAAGGGTGPNNPAAFTVGASRFVPPFTTSANATTMLLRLPDGRGFALTYPKSLDLSQFTVTAGGQVDWAVHSGALTCCSEYVAPYYGSVSSVFGGKPLAEYRGAHGQVVPYFAGTQERFPLLYPNMDYLAFHFGPWVVLVGDMVHSSYWTARMTNSERSTWARDFDAHIVSGGYLVLRPHSPLTVSRGAFDIVLTHDGSSLEISGPNACSPVQSSPMLSAGIGSWCDPHSNARIAATGSSDFVATASGLHVKSLQPLH